MFVTIKIFKNLFMVTYFIMSIRSFFFIQSFVYNINRLIKIDIFLNYCALDEPTDRFLTIIIYLFFSYVQSVIRYII